MRRISLFSKVPYLNKTCHIYVFHSITPMVILILIYLFSVASSLYLYMYMHIWLSWLRICLQCRRPRFDSWVRKMGKIPWRRKWQPSSAEENPMGRIPWAEKHDHGVTRVGHDLVPKPPPPQINRYMHTYICL